MVTASVRLRSRLGCYRLRSRAETVLVVLFTVMNLRLLFIDLLKASWHNRLSFLLVFILVMTTLILHGPRVLAKIALSARVQVPVRF